MGHEDGCIHNRPNYTKDILLVVGLILLALVLRELFAWFFKTNHTYTAVQANQRKLDHILQILHQNGLRTRA